MTSNSFLTSLGHPDDDADHPSAGGPAPAADRFGGPRAEDFDRPSSARVYDYLLGGATHGSVDRTFADRLLAAEPTVTAMARENRAFLRRAVRHLLATGVDQFLDLGSGVPTMGNVHEVVARSGSAAPVAYVDVDPVAAAHARHLLGDTPGTTFTEADVTDVDAVLGAETVRRVIDFDRPVGLLMFSVLQHVPGDPGPLVARYVERLARGSSLAVSHLAADDASAAMSAIEALTTSYPRSGTRGRTRDEVAALFDGVALVEPGVAWAPQWRPDPGRLPGADSTGSHWGAVGFVR